MLGRSHCIHLLYLTIFVVLSNIFLLVLERPGLKYFVPCDVLITGHMKFILGVAIDMVAAMSSVLHMITGPEITRK